MRIHTEYRYSLQELKDSCNQEAYEKALDALRERNTQSGDNFFAEECIDSLCKLCEAAGVSVTAYSFGAYSRNYLKLEMHDDYQDLSGPRALAWLENNLLGPLRQCWVRAVQWKKWMEKTPWRKRPYEYTKPGKVPECPFTGMMMDEVLLEALFESIIKDGDTLYEAFKGLEYHVTKVLEAEYDYQQTEEYLLEDAEANEYEFLASGCLV